MGLLEKYHFSEELDLIGPEEVELLTVAGAPEGAEELADLALPGTLPGTLDLVVADAAAAIARLGLPEASAEARDMARVAAGQPLVGRDTGPATLVQEAGLEGDAVSFEKGCYLGQETVARLQFRGRANRVLRGLRLPDPAPPPGGRCGPAGARWAASPASRRPPTWADRARRAPARGGAGRPGGGRGGRRARARGRASLRPVSDPSPRPCSGRPAPPRWARRSAPWRTPGWARSPPRCGSRAGPRSTGPSASSSPRTAARWWCTCPTTAARRSSARPGAARIRSPPGRRPAALTGGAFRPGAWHTTNMRSVPHAGGFR